MGGELLTEAPPQPIKTYTEQFHEVFPFYLSIGMTYELFWLEDSALVRDYRKADELHQERKNYEAWLQGAYIYDAFCAVSPVMNAFAKRGTKPSPYHQKPYTMRQEREEPSVVKEQEGAAKFHAFAEQFNKRFSKPSAVERQPIENGGGIDGSYDRPVTN